MGVVELDRNIRIEVVVGAYGKGAAIEIRNRLRALGHAELRIEILEPREHAELVLPASQRKQIAAFEVIPLQLPRDVWRDANRQRQSIVQACRVADEHACELATRF